jgi:hypothetical protein
MTRLARPFRAEFLQEPRLRLIAGSFKGVDFVEIGGKNRGEFFGDKNIYGIQGISE